VGNGWSEDAGAWEISSNTLKTSSANALISKGVGDADDGRIFEIKMYIENDGDQVVFKSETSVSGVYVLTLTFGTSPKIELTNEDYPGGNIAIGITGISLPLNQWVKFHMNYGYISLDDTPVFDLVDYLSLTWISGFIVGTGTLTGSAYFDDAIHSAYCELPPTCCTSYFNAWFTGSSPASITATFAGGGVSDYGWDFSVLDGTYSLDRYCGALNCEYTYTFPSPVTIDKAGGDTLVVSSLLARIGTSDPGASRFVLYGIGAATGTPYSDTEKFTFISPAPTSGDFVTGDTADDVYSEFIMLEQIADGNNAYTENTSAGTLTLSY
jgi:hypothetical protein